MSVLGVDFGNETCKVCVIKKGVVETVLNEASKRKNPTMLSFQGKRRLIAEAASSVAASNYKQTMLGMKRLLGRTYADLEAQEEIKGMPNASAYKGLPDGTIGCQVEYKEETLVLSVTEAVGMLLGKLKDVAQTWQEGREVKDCVVSVPSYYTEAQRSSMMTAIRIAGLNPLSLINESTATALDYGIWKNARNLFDPKIVQNHMFVDIGHSATTVTVVQYIQGQLKVLATVCDRNLGGRSIDAKLVNFFSEEFQKKHKLDPRTNPKSVSKLRAACEKAKQAFASEGVTFANVNVEFLMEERDLNGKITFDEFNTLCEPLLPALEKVLLQAKAESKVETFNSVEIVGGSARVRAFKMKIAEVMGIFDKTKPNYGLNTTMDIDESVARGCALRCAMLSPSMRVKEFAVLDFQQYPIRISWDPLPADALVQAASASDSAASSMDVDEASGAAEGGANKNSILLIERSLEIPKTRRLTLRRSQDFSVTAEYDVSAAPLLPPNVDRVIGKFSVSGLPKTASNKKGVIRMDFRLDVSSQLRVESCDLLEDVEVETMVTKRVKKSERPADAVPVPTKEGSTEKIPEDEEDVQVKEMKKKTNKTPLKVQEEFRYVLSAADMAAAVQRESTMVAFDRSEREREDMRNRLEAMIYTTRDRLDGELKAFGTEADLEAIRRGVKETENWLENEGFDDTKVNYENKLGELVKLLSKVEFRFRDQEERQDQASALTAQIQDYLAIVNSTEEKLAHLESSDRETVRKACSEAEAWLHKNLEAQSKTASSSDPVCPASRISDKISDLRVACKPIVEKKAPAKAAQPAAAAPATAPETAAPTGTENGDGASTPTASEPESESRDAGGAAKGSSPPKKGSPSKKGASTKKKDDPMELD